nr:ATP-dependent RNA helicase DRS1-like [Nicotiana tomentosiformis]
MANITISQLQQKLEVIELLREEVDTIREETLGWKDGIKERSSVQARKIEELEDRLASELAKAKVEAKKAKAEADAFVAVYRADAEAVQRETLEEIHAQGFDLTKEIKKDKELEAEAEALTSDEDDDDGDDDESKSESESGEELDGEEATLGDNQEP